MTIYTTLRPKYLIEYFGDDYNPKKQILKKPNQRKGWKIETYYHQEVRDSDLFLMIPHFSQDSLYELLKRYQYTPLYLTVYKDKEPDTSFFKDIGAICMVEEVFDVLGAINRFSELLIRHAHLPNILMEFPLLENALADTNQKKRLDDILSNLHAPDRPINYQEFLPPPLNDILDGGALHTHVNDLEFVPIDYIPMYGTRDASETPQTYIRRFNTRFFNYEGEAYYCLFTREKAYLFQDKSLSNHEDLSLIQIMEIYIDLILYSINKPKNKSQREALLTEVNSLLSVYDINHKKKVKKVSIAKEKMKSLLEEQKIQLASLGNKKTLFFQVSITEPGYDMPSKFSPIPISKQEIYRNFYFFIRQALQQEKLYIGAYDTNETQVGMTIGDETSFDKYTFYTRYTLYFLAQYTHDVEKMKEEEKTTLYHVIGNLAYERNKNYAANTIMINYQDYIDRPDGKNYTGKMHQLYLYLKEHYHVNDFFSDDLKSIERIERIEHYKTILQTNLLKKNNATSKEKQVPYLDTEFEKLTQLKKEIQTSFCTSEHSCLEKEDIHLICQQLRGNRFEIFERHLNPLSQESFYPRLRGNCKKMVDEYFALSLTYIYTTQDNDDEEDPTDNYLTYHLWTPEQPDMNLDHPIHELKASLRLYQNIPKDDLGGKSEATTLEDIETVTKFPLEDLIVKFLHSYSNLTYYSSTLYSIRIKVYLQILFLYMEKRLGSIDGQSDSIKEAKWFVRSVLFLLSKGDNQKKSTKTILGKIKYYDWLELFFSNIRANDIISWIYEEGEYSEDSWLEIKKRFCDRITMQYLKQAQKALPKKRKDIKLEHSVAKDAIAVYAQSIIDTYEILGINFGDKDFVSWAQKLNELEESRTNKKKYKLFASFLNGTSPENVMGVYLDKVVIEPNSDIYFQKVYNNF